MLHVLGVKAAANEAALRLTDNEAALRLTDTAMRVCGGTLLLRTPPGERYCRDARADHVMAPTAGVLYDFYS